MFCLSGTICGNNMAFELSVKGKTALVTGGARGIGAEICRALAQAGANIVINYYNSPADIEALPALEAEINAYGGKALSICADVANEAEVNKMFQLAEEKLNGVDILVNNAGITITSKLHEMTTQQWKTMNGVILDGAFYTTRAALPHMLRKKEGVIIMVTTNCTVNGGGGSAAYPAAKSGVEGIVKQLVQEYASQGIRANIVRPAVIDTDLFRQRYPTDDMVAAYAKSMPVGRVGTPSDIASAVVFLASPQASYICGESLLVDGGRTYYKK